MRARKRGEDEVICDVIGPPKIANPIHRNDDRFRFQVEKRLSAPKCSFIANKQDRARGAAGGIKPGV